MALFPCTSFTLVAPILKFVGAYKCGLYLDGVIKMPMLEEMMAEHQLTLILISVLLMRMA
jgi:hypothetical protein